MTTIAPAATYFLASLRKRKRISDTKMVWMEEKQQQ